MRSSLDKGEARQDDSAGPTPAADFRGRPTHTVIAEESANRFLRDQQHGVTRMGMKYVAPIYPAKSLRAVDLVGHSQLGAVSQRGQKDESDVQSLTYLGTD